MSIIKTIFTTVKEKYEEGHGGWAIFAIIFFGLGFAFGVLCLEAWIFSLVWELLLIGIFTLNLPTFTFWGYMGVMIGLSITLNFIGKRLFRSENIKVKIDDKAE